MTSINTHRLGQPSTETYKAGADACSSRMASAPAAQSGWWYRATVEERLAQIDGAIELGLTAVFVALNCGARSKGVVSVFANRHGRYFLGEEGSHREKVTRTYWKRAGSLHAAKCAYEHGEPVDFWSVE